MPDIQKRQLKARTKHARKPDKKMTTTTTETDGYLSGFYTDFSEQLGKYIQLVHHFLHIQARVELAEQNLRNTREAFGEAITRCTNDTVPQNWSVTLARAQFVGARLSEACMALLRKHRRLSQTQMLDLLNSGQYRWRTPTPLREIHGAMVKQAWATREADDYIWTGPDPQMRLDIKLAGFSPETNEDEEKVGKKAS